jgi:hypothetical protein
MDYDWTIKHHNREHAWHPSGNAGKLVQILKQHAGQPIRAAYACKLAGIKRTSMDNALCDLELGHVIYEDNNTLCWMGYRNLPENPNRTSTWEPKRGILHHERLL